MRKNPHQPVLNLFRPSLIDDIFLCGDTPLLEPALFCIKDHIDPLGRTNGEILDWIYKWMYSNYRIEYVYISEMLKQMVFPSSKKVALTQTRVVGSISDLIIIDGDIPIVYEIKTSHDSLKRLSSQIDNYLKVFSTMYVVVAEDFYDEVIDVIGARPVGIMILRDNNEIIRMRCAPLSLSSRSKADLYDMAWKYCSIQNISFMGTGSYPDTLTDRDMFIENKRSFFNIPYEDSYRIVMHEMRREVCSVSLDICEPLRALVYLYRRNIPSLRDKIRRWIDEDFLYNEREVDLE